MEANFKFTITMNDFSRMDAETLDHVWDALGIIVKAMAKASRDRQEAERLLVGGTNGS